MIKELIKELRKDKSNGSYYHSWQCNIAMAMYDVLPDDLPNKHELCNKGAINFLETFIASPDTTGKEDKPVKKSCESCGYCVNQMGLANCMHRFSQISFDYVCEKWKPKDK